MRKNKITKGENLLYKTAVVSLFFTIVLKVFCGAGISNMKIDIEEIKMTVKIKISPHKQRR